MPEINQGIEHQRISDGIHKCLSEMIALKWYIKIFGKPPFQEIEQIATWLVNNSKSLSYYSMVDARAALGITRCDTKKDNS